MDITKRQATLEQLRRILPPNPAWEAWLARTGELPPDFDQLPARANLPDLLAQDDGHSISSEEEWVARCAELRQRLQHWVVGTIPPPPDNLDAEVLSERAEAGATVREVRLRFGPGHRATLRLFLFIPNGVGPFPVFLTQATHRDWALIALRRGYLACIYAGADSFDDSDSFVEAYPDYDWSRLMRRAWAGSRCIDYLASVPQANMQQIAITGHSRNGKQSLMATAFDERIGAVISSSSGAGGVLSARYFSEQHFGEGIELTTRVFPDWFHPRMRFFVGREDRLPVDIPEMVALAAPRPCLLSIALNDPVESTWAMQQTYLAVRRVYELLGAEERLRILWRPGSHETWPAIIERYLDWCDTQFGREQCSFPERLIHPWDWERQQAVSRIALAPETFQARPIGKLLAVKDAAAQTATDWEPQRQAVRASVNEMLGVAPPMVVVTGGTYGQEPPHIALLLGRAEAGEGIEKQPLVFGEYISADCYMPAGLRDSGRTAPAVLWLHPFSYSNGYVAGYRRGEQFFRTLAQAGFAVFCFDQVGFGRRIEEVEGFYRRYPDWSLLGKLVRDGQAALDALGTLPYVDAQHIWGVGYGLGALVGLHLGALDERLAGLASVCGPPAFRLDTDEARTGGIRRWAQLHMLLPQLGNFIGQEERIPYDIDELLACMAPRPVLVVSPQLDREAPPDLVTPVVDAARQVYALHGAADRLEQLIPEDYNRFGPEMQQLVVEWVTRQTH